jgi:pimeloyl-ACP methyl ester carboxylesterase
MSRPAPLALALALLGCRAEAPALPPEPVPLHATRRADAAELCETQLRSWAVLDDGGEVVAITRGRCLGAIEHPHEGRLWQFVTQYQARGEASPRWELFTWLDASGRPRHAEFRTPTKVSRYAWQGEALELQRLGDRFVLDAARDVWVVPHHALHLRELMLRAGVGIADERVLQRSVSPEHDAVHELALTLDARGLAGEHAELRFAAPAEVLAGLRLGEGLAGGALRYRPLDAGVDDRLAPHLPARPRPRYEPAPSLELVAIEIPAKGEAPTLRGELVLPRERAPSGKLPGVLFVAGAGPQDRHGLVPDSAIDMGSHEIHDALAHAGFAVLRVDDRGVGGSELGEAEPGFDALVDDARRALASLAARPEVDARRILVIGHGEGALLASILAGEGVRSPAGKRALAGLILLAPPGRNLRELIYDEIRAAMADAREAEIRATLQRAREVHEAALADAELPASNVGARQWMIEAFAEDPLARVRAVPKSVPILALQGEADFQVSPERDFGPIAALLGERDACEARRLPGLDHLFKPETGRSTPGHYSDLDRQVDPELLALLVAWSAAAVE